MHGVSCVPTKLSRVCVWAGVLSGNWASSRLGGLPGHPPLPSTGSPLCAPLPHLPPHLTLPCAPLSPAPRCSEIVHFLTDNDSIGEAICKRGEALGAAAVIMAKHQRGAIAEFFLGSVTKYW